MRYQPGFLIEWYVSKNIQVYYYYMKNTKVTNVSFSPLLLFFTFLFISFIISLSFPTPPNSNSFKHRNVYLNVPLNEIFLLSLFILLALPLINSLMFVPFFLFTGFTWCFLWVWPVSCTNTRKKGDVRGNQINSWSIFCSAF